MQGPGLSFGFMLRAFLLCAFVPGPPPLEAPFKAPLGGLFGSPPLINGLRSHAASCLLAFSSLGQGDARSMCMLRGSLTDRMDLSIQIEESKASKTEP